MKDDLGEYIFLTLHRPSNVDRRETLQEIADALNEIAGELPIVFPVHPRTRKMLDVHGVSLSPRIVLLPPLPFNESLFLWKDAVMVMTDSGGLQEETTALGVRCVTIRQNTERPITVEMGTNILAGTRRDAIIEAFKESLSQRGGRQRMPPLWDGQASQRIWRALLDYA
jgi:UDP-N-acetylglucosamine 2-epimerase (non-hydrolysing)